MSQIIPQKAPLETELTHTPRCLACGGALSPHDSIGFSDNYENHIFVSLMYGECLNCGKPHTWKQFYKDLGCSDIEFDEQE